jgi:trk system potassium uptake protein TrkA
MQSGIRSCDTIIVCIGQDAAATFITVLNLLEMGILTVIAKATTYEEARILEKIGATRVIFPEKESAIRLANQMVSSDILEYIEISPDYQVAELEVPKEFSNKKLEDLHLMRKFNIIIIAIRRENEIKIIPKASEKLSEGDTLVIVGQTKDIFEFVKKFNPKAHKQNNEKKDN